MTLEDISAASHRIQDFIHRTPVLTSRLFNQRAGVQAFFKCENLQRGGSFKMRGAANFLHSLPPPDRAQGVVAFSSGNHAQAVAIAAQDLGIPATIVMPLDAPQAKVDSTAARGARIIRYDRYSQNREDIARDIAAQSGAALVPPFDHPWILTGAGTCGLELLQQAPNLDAIAVCLGGGGLLSGIAIAAKALNPNIRIYGVEPQAGNDFQLSLAAGHPVPIPVPPTIADGLQTTQPGRHTFPIVQRLVDSIVTVSEEELKETTLFLMTRLKLVVEPSGAAAAAAVLFHKIPNAPRIAITLSGGNLDLKQLAGW
jgi:threonine dehydratase